MTLVAVVNDDPQFLRLLEFVLNDAGYDTLSIQKQSVPFPELLEAKPDLVILDLHMDTDDAGWMILDLLRLDVSTTDTPVIVCSAAHNELVLHREHLAQNHARVLRKPFDIDGLLSLVRECLGQST